MKKNTIAIFTTIALATLPLQRAAGQGHHGGHGSNEAGHARRDEPPPRRPEEPPSERTIEVRVTEGGFEPARIVVKKGEHIRFVVTRVTDKTCARELVMDEFLVWSPLPLRRPFIVKFTPGRIGEFRFACASGAVAGILRVEE